MNGKRSREETRQLLTPLRANGRSSGLPPVIRDGLWSVLITFGSKASILAQIAIAGREGGPAGLGAFSQLVAAAVLIATLCDFGFTTEATRYAAAAGDRVDLGAVWQRLFWRLLTATVLTGTVSLLFGIIQKDVNVLSILLTSMYSGALFAGAVGIAIANGVGMFRFTGTTLGTARVMSVPVSFLALLVDSPNSVLIASIAICETVSALVIWRRVRKGGIRSLEPISVQVIDHHRALQFGAAGFINVLINRSDIFLLSFVMPLAALGAYATASQLENAVTTVALVPASALIVHVARAAQAGDDTTSSMAFRSTVTMAVLLSLVMALVLVVTAPFWIPVIFGEAMKSSIVPVRIVMAGATLNCVAGVTLMALSGLGRSSLVLKVWLITAAATLPVTYMLAQSYGEIGAALGAFVRDGALVTAALVAARQTTLLKRGDQMRQYVYGKTTRAGLGNELFPIIRAALIAHDRGVAEIEPVWIRPRLGPIIRGERDKRRYHQLFRRPGARAIAVRALVLLAAQRFDESHDRVRRGLPGHGVTVVKGMGRCFEDFRGRRQLVLSILESRSRRPCPRQSSPNAAMHVRLGDFSGATNGGVIARNESTSMEWFVDVAVAITDCGLPVSVFSDGKEAELAPLLSLPLVSRAPTGTALSDMLDMSGHVLIVGSGSTFTAWGAFLQDRPLLLFPGTNHYLKWSERVVEEADALGGVSQILSMISSTDAILGLDD